MAAAVVGCGGGGGGKTPTEPPGGGGGGARPAIALSLSTNSLSLAEGGSGTVTVTISRSGGYTGSVSLTLEGAPAGVTGGFQPASLASGQTSSTLTIDAAAAAAAGQGTLTVRASGAGVDAKTATLSLTVTAAAQPDFSMAASPATVTVRQGESATSTVNITRKGGFAGSVALAVSGAPAGVTATLASANTTEGTVGLTVAASSSAATGSYTLTITGTATGVTGSRTATLGVSVSAGSGGGGGTGSVSWQFCGPDSPIWFAVQDGDRAWTRVTGANDTYRFDLPSGRGGVAYVQDVGGGRFDTKVEYGTAEELTAMGKERCISDTRKTVTGTVAGMGLTDMARITLGSSTGAATGTQLGFTLEQVPGGVRDLIASRTKVDYGAGGVTMNLDRVIIRRGVNAAAGSTLPVLDFGGSEAFAPEPRTLTVSGSNGSPMMLTGIYMTGNNPRGGALLDVEMTATSVATTRAFSGIPQSKQASGDVHMLTVVAFDGGVPADVMAPAQQRTVNIIFARSENRSASLGPALATPTISGLGGGRYRAQIPKQAEYPRYWTATFGAQSAGSTGNNVVISATAAWVGAATTVDLAIPDFGAVPGWSPSWRLSGTVFWQASASAWEGTSFLQPTLDGAVIRTAIRSGGIS